MVVVVLGPRLADGRSRIASNITGPRGRRRLMGLGRGGYLVRVVVKEAGLESDQPSSKSSYPERKRKDLESNLASRGS